MLPCVISLLDRRQVVAVNRDNLHLLHVLGLHMAWASVPMLGTVLILLTYVASILTVARIWLCKEKK